MGSGCVTFLHIGCILLLPTVVLIGFSDSQVVVSEPSTFNISVVLLENNLDPGTSVSLDITAVDGLATGNGCSNHINYVVLGSASIQFLLVSPHTF